MIISREHLTEVELAWNEYCRQMEIERETASADNAKLFGAFIEGWYARERKLYAEENANE